MDERGWKNLLDRLGRMERRSGRVRYGRISDVDPLSVRLGDADPFTDVRALSSAGALAVNDHVAVWMQQNDLLVLGKVT